MRQVSARRSERLETIRRLLDGSEIDSQFTLLDRLSGLGFDVNQSTLSRDLQDLGFGKLGGRYVKGVKEQPTIRVRSVRAAGPNLLVLKTDVAAANLIAAQIDAANNADILGTIAGDDTIFIATSRAGAQKDVIEKLGINSLE